MVFVVAASGCGSGLEYDAQQCMDVNAKDPNVAVRSCTAVIDSGKLSKHDLMAAYLNRGEAHKNQKEYEMALRDFTQSIAIDATAIAFNGRGVVYDLMGDFEHALQDYAEAIRLQPDFALPFNNRGLVFAEKEDDQLALQDFSKAISLKHD
jgi:tetratricopeptide (TPR) repeat protein